LRRKTLIIARLASNSIAGAIIPDVKVVMTVEVETTVAVVVTVDTVWVVVLRIVDVEYCVYVGRVTVVNRYEVAAYTLCVVVSTISVKTSCLVVYDVSVATAVENVPEVVVVVLEISVETTLVRVGDTVKVVQDVELMIDVVDAVVEVGSTYTVSVFAV